MRIKIETKIGGVLLIFFIELIIFTYFAYAIDKKHDQDHFKLHKSAEKMQLVRSIQIGLAQVVMPANDFLIPGGSPDESENFKILCGKVEGLIKRISDIKFNHIEEGQLIKHIEKEYLELKNIALQIFSMPDVIGNIEAGKLMEKMDAIADSAIKDAENFSQFVHSENLQIEAKSDMTKALFGLIILIGILINIIFILGLWFFFKHTISSPIIHLRDVALEIAKGDTEKRADIKLKDEIGELGLVFNHMIDALKASEKDIRQSYQIQGILNKLLKISLENISLEEVLEKALIHLTPWSEVMPKGGIFLMEDKQGVLVLKAQQGLSAEIQTMCVSVPFGRCLCGKAALSGEMIFSDHIDERHENRYKGMMPHGHYCVPIISIDKEILGVINLYLDEGHQTNNKEKEFLHAVANILAGIIERKKIEENLRVAYYKLKEAQDHLIQAEKLNAVGQLASGVAHEVRNPLAIMLQGVDYLEKKVSSSDKNISETLSLIKDSIIRADTIIRTLIDFSRVSKLDLESENINTILENSLVMIQYRFKLENVKIIKDMKNDLPRVSVDKRKMEQVFVNIFLNAIQAMPEGGKLFIRSYSKEIDKLKEKAGKRNEDYFRFGEKVVVVEIEDTGIGIFKEHIGKVFDPFFTTKGPQEGTGLGLSVTKSILQLHKGLIEIESQENKGTKVIITLKIA
ncbi:MAG: ATP-binding protein [Candidatus Omnitrophota bacterium]|nr:ATP-binding protein [Candidatus Omnitrophota bacterium]